MGNFCYLADHARIRLAPPGCFDGLGWTYGESNSSIPDANRAHYHCAIGPPEPIENARFPKIVFK